jgi:hypothetical protein
MNNQRHGKVRKQIVVLQTNTEQIRCAVIEPAVTIEKTSIDMSPTPAIFARLLTLNS